MVVSITVDGKKLIEVRRTRYLSRAELAMKGDLTIGAVQRIEQTGVTGITLKTLRKLAIALKMEPEDLEAALRPNGDASHTDFGDLQAEPPTWDIEVAAGPWSHAPVCELDADDPEQSRVIQTGRFRLRLQGTCMEPDYPSGSTVEFRILVLSRDQLELGRDYVMCKSDCTATFKRLAKVNDDTYSLVALNQDDYPGLLVVDKQDVVRIAAAVAIVQPLAAGKIPKVRPK